MNYNEIAEKIKSVTTYVPQAGYMPMMRHCALVTEPDGSFTITSFERPMVSLQEDGAVIVQIRPYLDSLTSELERTNAHLPEGWEIRETEFGRFLWLMHAPSETRYVYRPGIIIYPDNTVVGADDAQRVGELTRRLPQYALKLICRTLSGRHHPPEPIQPVILNPELLEEEIMAGKTSLEMALYFLRYNGQPNRSGELKALHNLLEPKKYTRLQSFKPSPPVRGGDSDEYWEARVEAHKRHVKQWYQNRYYHWQQYKTEKLAYRSLIEALAQDPHAQHETAKVIVPDLKKALSNHFLL